MIGKLDPEESVMDENVELMYKAPGRDEHQNITKVLDEIMNRLDRIEAMLEEGEERLISVEESVDDLEEEGTRRIQRIEDVGMKVMEILEMDADAILEEVDD